MLSCRCTLPAADSLLERKSGFISDDFKPESLDSTKSSTVSVEQNNSVTVSVPHVEVSTHRCTSQLSNATWVFVLWKKVVRGENLQESYEKQNDCAVDRNTFSAHTQI